MKKTGLTFTASGISVVAMSQPAESAGPGILQDPMLPLYLASVAVILLLVLVTALTLYVVRILNTLTNEAIRQKAEASGKAVLPASSWWKRFIDKMNASVPVEQEKEIELEHSYDGIRELDNHLPPWWKWLFYGTIAWGVVYFIVFHVTDSMPLALEEYHQELALAEDAVKRHQAAQPKALIDENTLVYTDDPATLEKGKTIFLSNNCGGCHRNDGGGNTIGPNLTDDYWLHGGELKRVFLTIKNGVVEKGMPAWGKSMSAQDVRDVTFFVMSLRGTNPPDAKAPQGELFKQEPNLRAGTEHTGE